MVNVANALSEPGVTAPVRIYCADKGRTRTPLGEAPISHWFAMPTPTASGPKVTGVPSPFNTCTPIPFTVDSGDNVRTFDRFDGVTASVMTMDTCAPVEQVKSRWNAVRPATAPTPAANARTAGVGRKTARSWVCTEHVAVLSVPVALPV